MATTGLGDHPFVSVWFSRFDRLGGLPPNGTKTTVQRPVVDGSDGTTAGTVWSDFFFEAAAAGTGPSMIWVLDDDITILRRPT